MTRLFKPANLTVPATVRRRGVPVGEIRRLAGLQNLWVADDAKGTGSAFAWPDLVTGVPATPVQPNYGPKINRDGDFTFVDFSPADGSGVYSGGAVKINQVINLGTEYSWVMCFRMPDSTTLGNQGMIGSYGSDGMRITILAGANDGLIQTKHTPGGSNYNSATGRIPEGAGNVVFANCYNTDDNRISWRVGGAEVETETGVTVEPETMTEGSLFGTSIGVGSSFYGRAYLAARFAGDMSLAAHAEDMAFLEAALADVDLS